MKWIFFLLIEVFFCWFGFFHLGVSFKKLLAAWSAVAGLSFPFFFLAYLVADSIFNDLKKKKEDELRAEINKNDAKYQLITSDLRYELAEKETQAGALIDDISGKKKEIAGLYQALQTKQKICDRFADKVKKLS